VPMNLYNSSGMANSGVSSAQNSSLEMSVSSVTTGKLNTAVDPAATTAVIACAGGLARGRCVAVGAKFDGSLLKMSAYAFMSDCRHTGSILRVKDPLTQKRTATCCNSQMS